MSNISPGKGKHLTSRSHGHTHTHTHTCAFFPVKPRQWPERGTVQSTAAAGELEVWRAGKSLGRRIFGCDTSSRRCWCQPVIWGGETHQPPAAGEMAIWLRLKAPPWGGDNCGWRGPFNYVDKSITKSSCRKAPRIAHVWNQLHVFNKEGHEPLAQLLRAVLRGSSLPPWITVNDLI